MTPTSLTGVRGWIWMRRMVESRGSTWRMLRRNLMSCWTGWIPPSSSSPKPLPRVTSSSTVCSAPGYQHVVHLAHCLIKCCTKGYVTQAKVEEIVWGYGRTMKCNAVCSHLALKTRTSIQLLSVNQNTFSQWWDSSLFTVYSQIQKFILLTSCWHINVIMFNVQHNCSLFPVQEQRFHNQVGVHHTGGWHPHHTSPCSGCGAPPASEDGRTKARPASAQHHHLQYVDIPQAGTSYNPLHFYATSVFICLS